MLLLDDLLLAPFSGFNFILRTLRTVAEQQWTDDAPLKEQLLELQVQLDNGEITEEQYYEIEEGILKAIREVNRRKLELAGGGPMPLKAIAPAGSGERPGRRRRRK
jgi:hypothetical protein